MRQLNVIVVWKSLSDKSQLGRSLMLGLFLLLLITLIFFSLSQQKDISLSGWIFGAMFCQSISDYGTVCISFN